MKRLLVAAVIASSLVVAACETATPYQPIAARGILNRGGYFDHQIETDRWQVGFKGNELTSRETVERYLLYRSAELTLRQGYDWFEAGDRHTDKKTEGFAIADPYYAGYGGFWGPRWGVYRRGFGWRYGYGYGDPYWGPGADYSQINQFEASAEIVMGHGQKPADRQAFDAHSVVEHLSSAVHPPQ